MTLPDGFLQAALVIQVVLPILGAVVLLSGRVPRSLVAPLGQLGLLACIVLLVVMQAAFGRGDDHPAIVVSPASFSWLPRAGLSAWSSGLRADVSILGLWTLSQGLGLTGLIAEGRDEVREDRKHVAAALLLQSFAGLFLTAEHALLKLAAGGLLALTLSCIVGKWGGSTRRTAAARLLGVQLIGLISLAAGLAIAAGVVSLMQSAPYGTPATTTFDIPQLLERYDLALRRHPAAEPVMLQLADWLLLAAILPVWLSGAIFPLHGWFQEVWNGSPLAVRVWLGGLGLKLPFVTILPLWEEFTGSRVMLLVLCCTWSALFGLLITTSLAAAFRHVDRVGANLTLMTGHLIVLLACMGVQHLLVPLLIGATGVTLFELSLQKPADTASAAPHGVRKAHRAARWLAVFALTAIPGGGGFFMWRMAIVQAWAGTGFATGWAVWILLIAATIATVSAVIHACDVQQGPEPEGCRAQGSRTAIIVWGVAAVAAGIFPWLATGSREEPGQPVPSAAASVLPGWDAAREFTGP